uniref:Ig-like domain-containing protein n=1 Tax=Monopterus albus TaxID=43700 RepID=A0A3Q3QS24_MONAL
DLQSRTNRDLPLPAVSEKIRASAGGTVILPCHISHSVDIPTVEWSKEGLDPNIIFLYQHGCDTFEMKNQVFQFRTNLIMNKVKDGDISLHMFICSCLIPELYQCRVFWERNPETCGYFLLLPSIYSYKPQCWVC